MNPSARFNLRPLQASDSLAELTALLHRAYAPLGAAGMNFTAVHQTEAQTAERVRHGHCLVAERDGRLIGTVTVNGAFDPNIQAWARATPWFYRADVAHFHQFAVAPEVQGEGIGSALLAGAEAWARNHGHAALALDTAVPATALRQRYARAGFDVVDEVHWGGKTYRSVVMLKPLAFDGRGQALPVPSLTDAQHHAALVRCWWAHVQARDWPAARHLLADDAQLHWPASGEWLLDADAIVKVQAIYPEGWRITVLEVTPMCDGRVHSWVRVDQGETTFFAHTLWRLAGDADARPCIAGASETWATAEAPPAWRTAEALGAYRREPWPRGA
ncbi:GNAT family N-acetyltransferase [Ideonella sp. DXS22W]|uniref:GNAT family N-acetyltransferase n=1 Tax=Pseudaquabacterium inlustre TaxID=2984192 RepID=A0ABU9CQV0_9BURK